MDSQVTFTPNGYGFGYDWNLNVTTHNSSKSFYLGQDVKFCRRVLGMEPSYVVEQIGNNDLRNVETQKKLGDFIINTLGLSEQEIDTLESWELCCQ
jgi:hypothetical protein